MRKVDLGMRVQLALSSISQLNLCVPGLLVRLGPQAVRYSKLGVQHTTNATLRKWEVFKSWNFTSFVPEKSVQWTCS